MHRRAPGSRLRVGFKSLGNWSTARYKEVVLRAQKKDPPRRMPKWAVLEDIPCQSGFNTSRSRLLPGFAFRAAWKYRAASEMAVVATPLSTILPHRPYDQEIKSLLLYQLRASLACRTQMHDLPLRRRSVFGIEPTTNGLTVRRSTAEAERTGLEPAIPGCSWVLIPLSPPPLRTAIGRFSRTSLFHGGNRLTARDGRLIPARGFESHPLRRTEREGFGPSQQWWGHSPLKAMTTLSEQRIFSPLLGEPAERRPYKANVGGSIPLGTPPRARKSL
jgi:hypothetical protein